MMDAYLQKLNELLQNRTATVSVILVETVGSTPQDRGSKMLVTTKGLVFGTIGGGRAEYRALEIAQTMLVEKHTKPTNQFVEWNLNQDVGMTCGGVVKLYFEVFQPSF